MTGLAGMMLVDVGIFVRQRPDAALLFADVGHPLQVEPICRLHDVRFECLFEQVEHRREEVLHFLDGLEASLLFVLSKVLEAAEPAG